MEKDLRFKKAYCYMITCKITNEKYIGSSCDTEASRLHNHKKQMKNENNIRGNCSLYQHMREFGFENFIFTKIEDWPCDNLKQLQKRETYWQVVYNTVQNGLNGHYASAIPIYEAELQKIIDLMEKKKLYLLNKTKTRNYLKNPEKTKECKKKHYEKNKDKILPKMAIYREEHKEERKEYDKQRNQTKEYKERRKELYRENIDIKKQQNNERYKKWVENNKEEIECECGVKLMKKGLAKHKKSKRHLEYIVNSTIQKSLDDLKENK